MGTQYGIDILIRMDAIAPTDRHNNRQTDVNEETGNIAHLPLGLDSSFVICAGILPQYHGNVLGSVGDPQRAAYLLLAAAKAPKWDIRPNLKQ